jgi:hypothetical protein
MLKLTKVGHHTPPADITEDVPVEVFAEQWDRKGTPDTDMLVEEVLQPLTSHLEKALVRVAVPTALGHHRCLDIENVALGKGDANNPFLVELLTERWDNAWPIIRDDEPKPSPDNPPETLETEVK